MGKHVVFGAGGALGAAIVQNLVEQNKSVRAVVRDVGRACKVLPSSAEIVAADASKREDIKPAFQDVSVVYHCVNVPYDKWTEVMPLVTDNILAGAIEKKANIVFPGNVYVYGRFQKIPAPEDHPPAATSKKGKLRIGIEKELMDAHGNGKVKVVIPRFPDYYGLIELMYEFEEPLVLNGSKFSTKFPLFKYTSHEEGIRDTIDWFSQGATS